MSFTAGLIRFINDYTFITVVIIIIIVRYRFFTGMVVFIIAAYLRITVA